MLNKKIVRDKAVTSQERIFKEIAENVPFGIVFIEASGRYSYINPKFVEMFGYNKEEVSDGRAWFSKAYPDSEYRHLVIKTWKEDINIVKLKEKRPRVFHIRCKNGDVKIVNITTVKIKKGKYMSTFEDITERVTIENALKESEEKFKSLVESSLAGVYIIQDNVFKYANRRFAEIHGYSIEEMIDRLGPRDMVIPEDLPLVEKEIQARISNEKDTSNFTFRAKRKDGKTIHVEVFGSKMMYQGRPSIIGTLIDITEKVKAEEIIRHMAYHDTLTGLPNRALLFDRLQMAMAAAKRKKTKVAVMMIDLDRFKDVNDVFGHEAGDTFLKDIAKNIEGVIRKTDTVARMGGDEFLVVLADIKGIEDALLVSRKILHVSKKSFEKDGNDFYITASIGISIYPEDGLDSDTLIRKADIALYRAKNAGKDRAAVYKN